MLALAQNPHASIQVVHDGGEVVAVRTYAPLRGRPMLESSVETRDDPSRVALLLRVKASRGVLRLQPPDVDALTELGLLVSPQEIAAISPLQCLASVEPDDDAPDEPPVAGPWVPAHGLQAHAAPPPWFDAPPAWWCAPREGVVYAWEHSGTGVMCFAQPDASLAPSLRALCEGRPPASSAAVRRALVRIGALVPADLQARERARWATQAALARDSLTTEGWCGLPEILPDFYRAALVRHLHALRDGGFFSRGSAFSPLRHGMGNGAWPGVLHRQLQPLVERCCGRAVEATLAYSIIYETGADLPRHTDRPECDLVVSMLLLDDGPGAPWPLWLEARSGRHVATNTLPGGAVLYEGRARPHWRTPLPEGRRVTLIAFCYRRLQAPA